MTAEPAKGTTFRALEIAKDAGCIVSYDPNYRAPLWDSKEAAIEGMRSVISYVDVMKISDEETALLTDIVEPEGAAKKLVDMGMLWQVCVLKNVVQFLRCQVLRK